MAKEKNISKEESELRDRRTNQITQLGQVIDILTKKVDEVRQRKQKVDLLQSVSLGLYDEMDKLAKKTPVDVATDLVVEQVNEFIEDARGFMADDAYILRCKKFVPAGDNPQHRDVVMVMRQMRQGLERLDTSLRFQQTHWAGALADAKGVQFALQLALEGYDEVSKSDLKQCDCEVKDRWFLHTNAFETDPSFSFAAVDRTDISTYFTAEQ